MSNGIEAITSFADIKQKLLLDGHSVNVYMLDTAIGSTCGAIVVFN